MNLNKKVILYCLKWILRAEATKVVVVVVKKYPNMEVVEAVVTVPGRGSVLPQCSVQILFGIKM